MSTDWSSRCESNGCLQTRRVTVDDVEYIQIRDSELDGSPLLVTVAAWEAHEAAIRAEALRAAATELMLMTTDPFDLLTESVGSKGPIAVSLWLQDQAAQEKQ